MVEAMQNSTFLWQELDDSKKHEYILRNGQLADCSFIVGRIHNSENKPRKFECHKLILACASPVFERMFYGDFKECEASKDICLTDIESGDFKNFLDFIYCNNKQNLEALSIDALKSHIYIGNKYMVKAFTDACIQIMKRMLNELNNNDLISVFEFSHFIASKSLIDECTKVITKKWSGLEDIDFNVGFEYCSHTYDLDACIFYEFIKILKGFVSEAMRFKIIEMYVKMNSLAETLESADKVEVNIEKDVEKQNGIDAVAANENECGAVTNENRTIKAPAKENLTTNKNILSKLLKIIIYKNMSVAEFCQGAGKSDLLDIQTKYKILAEIANEDQESTTE